MLTLCVLTALALAPPIAILVLSIFGIIRITRKSAAPAEEYRPPRPEITKIR